METKQVVAMRGQSVPKASFDSELNEDVDCLSEKLDVIAKGGET
jgi:hypothetical protein